jgi:hypothetical protein
MIWNFGSVLDIVFIHIEAFWYWAVAYNSTEPCRIFPILATVLESEIHFDAEVDEGPNLNNRELAI